MGLPRTVNEGTAAMIHKSNQAHLSLNWILLAGFAGGLAEVLWVSLYAALSPLQGWDVAREIAASVLGASIGASLAPAVGLLIHFALSAVVALAFVTLLQAPPMRRLRPAGAVVGALAMLAAIWAMNFFVLLPVLNPAFVALLPLSVSFASKMLFGLGLGVTLNRAAASRRRGGGNCSTGSPSEPALR